MPPPCQNHEAVRADNGRPLCLVRGCGDIGSAIAHALFCAGYAVLIHDVANPSFARRGMAFTDAIYEGSACLEGVAGRLTKDVFSIRQMIGQGKEIPVVVESFTKMLEYLRPHVLIDARMNKRSIPDRQLGLAPLTIGLGPNFAAGENTNLVVETAWEDLGRILVSGSSRPLSGEPRPINGFGRERYVYAPADGRFETDCVIGECVVKGQAVACIGDEVIRSPLDGCLRGLSHAGAAVKAGTKVVEVDPRGDPARAFGIAERPGRLAHAVLAAVAGQRGPATACT
jgi:xanthine dehydrogenase accessory factor